MLAIDVHWPMHGLDLPFSLDLVLLRDRAELGRAFESGCAHVVRAGEGAELPGLEG